MKRAEPFTADRVVHAGRVFLMQLDQLAPTREVREKTQHLYICLKMLETMIRLGVDRLLVRADSPPTPILEWLASVPNPHESRVAQVDYTDLKPWERAVQDDPELANLRTEVMQLLGRGNLNKACVTMLRLNRRFDEKYPEFKVGSTESFLRELSKDKVN